MYSSEVQSTAPIIGHPRELELEKLRIRITRMPKRAAISVRERWPLTGDCVANTPQGINSQKYHLMKLMFV